MSRTALFPALVVVIASLGCSSGMVGTTPAGSGGSSVVTGSGGGSVTTGSGGESGTGTGGVAASGGAPATGGNGADAGDAAAPGDGGPVLVDADGVWDPTSLGGASKCAGSPFQICDDFESGTLDKTTWTVQGTAPVIDGMQFARGSKALHITSTNGSSTRLTEKKTFPEADDTYYGRVFYYFKSLPTPTGGLGYSHWTLLAGTGDGQGAGGEIRFGAQMLNSVNKWGTGTDNQSAGGTGDWTNVDQDPAPDGKAAHVPTGVWLCIEWMHAGPPANQTKIWVDGVLHPSIATTETMHGTMLTRGAPSAGMGNFILPNFTALWIGWQAYSGTQLYEFWMDEVAINNTRIGCAN
ncbi:MAG TPA: hypothetical protein VH374_05060 [Polyangia bacterium]|jgi:hypothetical protein|nr:hypothetical protein [Polyangia bacterium]